MSNSNLSPECQALLTAGPNTPVTTVIVNGAAVAVTAFSNVDQSQGIAYFLDGTDIVTVDCSKLDSVTFTTS